MTSTPLSKSNPFWTAIRTNPIRFVIALVIAAEVIVLNVAPGVKVGAITQVVVAAITAFLGELGRAKVIPISKVNSAQDDLAHLLAVLEEMQTQLPSQAGLAGQVSGTVIQAVDNTLVGFQQHLGGLLDKHTSRIAAALVAAPQIAAPQFDPMAHAREAFPAEGKDVPQAGIEDVVTAVDGGLIPMVVADRPEAPAAEAVAAPAEAAPVPQVYVSYLAESPGEGRLGRHIEHDPMSRSFGVAPTPMVSSVLWTRRVPCFDQGNIASCTGNAAAGLIGTDNSKRQGRTRVVINDPSGFTGLCGEIPVDEALAVGLYKLNTHLDAVPGTYPTQDTGSSGLASAKALIESHLAAGVYRHAFGVQQMISALQLGPVLVGIPWFSGFDRPDPTSGLVALTGIVRGGHELEVIGVDLTEDTFIVANSWGQQWTKFVPVGCAGKGGYFQIPVQVMTDLLSDWGDVVSVLAV